MSKLKRRSAIVVILFVLLCGTVFQMPGGHAQAEEASFDSIIRNGTILDGSGLPRYEADIGIRNGIIARIGDLSNFSAKTDLDAEGLFVTPGFIDLHSHASSSALQEAKSSLTQGVTTELLNVDGGGPTDLNEWYALEEEGLGINIGAYIGFNSVWEEVVGNEDRRASPDEIRQMQSLIRQAMEDGAFGVSAGLFYRPGYYADTDEVIDVVKAAREWRTNFPNHIRNENNEVVEATAETIEIGEEAGLNPHITHMKVMGPNNWGKSEETVRLIEEANARGMYATADVYPYLRSQTGLTAIVPPWVEEGGREEMFKRFADPELRPQIAQEIEEIMHSRVESEHDVYFPTKRKTLADYMRDFSQGTEETGRALLSFLNFAYDSDMTFYIDEFTVTDATGETAFAYDFKGNDGDPWDPAAFGDDLFSYPSDAVTYSIYQNSGQIKIAERQQGNASAYGKLEPIMPNLKRSEALMRFRVSEVGSNQRIRLWVQADKFGSGSSFPVNGYGVELHLGNDYLTLYGREDGSSTNLGRVDANMTTDWHWLKVRAHDNEVSVRLWNDNEEEPAEWDIVYQIPPSKQTPKRVLLNFINVDQDIDNTFYLDNMTITSPSKKEPEFEYDFGGNDGDAWDATYFDELHSYPTDPDAVTYSIEQNTGKIELGKRQEAFCCSTYGKVVPNMENLHDSELLMRFRTDKVGHDQKIRAFIRADKFPSGSSMPVNGYGIELNLKTDELVLFGRDNNRTIKFGHVEANMTTDWHWLRLRAHEDELAVRLWSDDEDEPTEWDVVHDTGVSPGEATMRILETEGNMRTIYNFGHEDDFKRILQNPTTAIASDGGATTSSSVHPRRYGTQPRALGRYVREKGFVEWEEMIRKMTGLPATIIGMTDRGFIAEGMVADMTVFDPETVIDKATFDDPKQYAEGIEYVFVNGQLALAEGELTGTQAGQALKRAPNMPSRPMTSSEPIHVDGKGNLVSMDSDSEPELQVDYSVDQDPDARMAEGHFRIRDANNELDFEAEGFGKIQVADGWVSFTGRGMLNGSEERTFRVIIDEHEPLVDDERSTVTIQIEGMDDIRGFLDQVDTDPLSIEQMKALVEQFVNEGEITDNAAARNLLTHLTAVGRYEETGQMDKAIKHMNSFKQLLDYQKEKEWISEQASSTLAAHADRLIEKWK